MAGGLAGAVYGMMTEKIDSDTFRWIVGGIMGVLIGLGTLWLNRVESQITDLTREFYQRGQRLSVLEAQTRGFDQRLERIEAKQDAILDRVNSIRVAPGGVR